MRPRTLLIIALILGLVAAVLTARWIGAWGAKSAGVPIVVAREDIEPGRPIQPGQVSILRWPSESIPVGAHGADAEVVGRFAREKVTAGEPLTEAKLAPVRSRGGLAAVIAPGKRAITVRVNDVVAVAGFALPGSYVDVLVSARDTSGEQFSKTVLSRVKVLAVEQDTRGDPTAPKVANAVTLELTPQEAEELDLARNIGNLSLILRNEFDKTNDGTVGARLNDLVHNGTPAQGTGPAVPVVAQPVVRPRAGRPTSGRPSSNSNDNETRGIVEFRGLKQEVR
ncbi:MAG: Flp pilus assembly protein CpaB [Chakrabartia sp.]